MDFVETVFSNTKIDSNKLLEYGFIKNNNLFEYKTSLFDDLILYITYDDTFKIKVFDVNINEEYLAYQYKSRGSYSNQVKTAIEEVLIDIKEHVSLGFKYKFSQTNRLDEYMCEVYGKGYFPFTNYPNIGAYKNGDDKWYALINNVSYSKLDTTSKNDEIVEIINLKVKPKEINNLIKTKGIFPAFHMNKKNWISIVLNDTLSDGEIILLINDSYDLVEEGLNNKKFYRRKTY